MRVHPLVTVKKAASLLGVDKRLIRDKLRSGELKGELRRVGVKDKWFVYSGEVDFLLESQRLPELEAAQRERTSVEGMGSLFEPENESEDDDIASENGAGSIEVQVSDGDIHEEVCMNTETMPALIERNKTGQLQMPFEQVIEIMTRHFSLRLCEEQDKLEELRRVVANQTRAISQISALSEKLSAQADATCHLRQELSSIKDELTQLRKPITAKINDWFVGIFRQPAKEIWLLKSEVTRKPGSVLDCHLSGSSVT